MRLFIAEKPSLGRSLAEAIGNATKKDRLSITLDNGDIITWAAGHILELQQPEEINPKYKYWSLDTLPILPTEWKMQPKAQTKDLFENIGKLLKSLKNSDVVVNAGDADREGQLLIDEILEYYNYKGKVLRILVTDMNASAIQKALAEMKPNDEYKNLSLSARARTRADWLVGINLTRLFTVTNERARGESFSVGRVQTPTLALVVNRERLIKNFEPTTYYIVKARSIVTNGEFVATWKPKEEQEGLDSDGRIIDEKIIDALERKLHSKVGHVTNFKKGTSLTQPSLTYSLPSLQIDASKVYGMSPDNTLKVLQSIYEAKYVTYPRSDCGYLPETLYDNRDNVLAALRDFSDEYKQCQFDTSLKSSAWNTSKTAEHHGIIPTGTPPRDLSDEQKKIYDLIARRYAAQFLPPQEFAAVEIEYKIEDEIFSAKARQCTKQGWHALYSKVTGLLEDEKETKDKDDDSSPIPDAVKGEGVGIRELIREDKKTTPPKRFTDATLLSAMNNIYKFVEDPEIKKVLKETQGIGTAATQAGIIANLFAKGYLLKEGKVIVPTQKGCKLIDAVDETMRKPDTTALWEQSLAEVENGKRGIDSFMSEIAQAVERMTAERKEVATEVRVTPQHQTEPGETCPLCGEKELRQRENKEHKKYWKCYKCGATVNDERGKPQKAVKCPSCGDGLVLRWKRKDGKNYFWKCRKCEKFFDDENGKLAAKK